MDSRIEQALSDIYKVNYLDNFPYSLRFLSLYVIWDLPNRSGITTRREVIILLRHSSSETVTPLSPSKPQGVQNKKGVRSIITQASLLIGRPSLYLPLYLFLYFPLSLYRCSSSLLKFDSYWNIWLQSTAAVLTNEHLISDGNTCLVTIYYNII